MSIDLTRADEMVAAAEKHRAIDGMLRAGTYAEKNGAFHGCSIGCFAYEIDPDREDFAAHKTVSDFYEYPEWLARLQDTLFEELGDERDDWHVQIARAIRAFKLGGGDWQVALHKIHAGILEISLRTAGSASEEVGAVRDLHGKAARGEEVSDNEWSAARSAAWSAVESAAESAAWSAARSAAWSAAWSAERSAAYKEIRDVVLSVLGGKQ